MVTFRQPTTDTALLAEAEHIHHAWNAALEAKDTERAAALYAEDATIESPLIRYLLNTDEGIIRGRAAIREFLPIVFKHQPEERRTHRNPVFTDGETLMWEYPRATPDGDQMDFTEVMQFRDGLIQRHRVYWGWFGVRTLTSGSHGR
ncbi:MAG TPA: nuclear transport factor 2 family protein [Rhodopila sp.]|jgi:ketosteroid isomerase-like protein|nr:nuclear transport factor 2 family protein [Rhodopila sp.]